MELAIHFAQSDTRSFRVNPRSMSIEFIRGLLQEAQLAIAIAIETLACYVNSVRVAVDVVLVNVIINGFSLGIAYITIYYLVSVAARDERTNILLSGFYDAESRS